MITPSPNVGCSTSSPMRSPTPVASVGSGLADRRRGRRRRRGRGGRRCAFAVVVVPVTATAVRRRAPAVTAAAGSGGRTAAAGDVALGLDSSAGISSRNRDGGLYCVDAEQAAAPGMGDVQPLTGPGDADVGEAAFLLQLVGLGRATASAGRSPSSAPTRNTTGNSRPLAECSVISTTWSSTSPSEVVRVGDQRRPARGTRRPGSNSPRRADELAEVLDAARRLDRVLGLQLGHVARPLEGRLRAGRPARPVRPRPCGRPAMSISTTNDSMPRTRRPGDPGLVGVAEGVEEAATPVAAANCVELGRRWCRRCPRLGTLSTRLTLTSSDGLTTARR